MKTAIFESSGYNIKYASWLMESFKYNGYKIVVKKNKEMKPQNFAFLYLENKKIGLDWCDGATHIKDEIADCDLYFKANLSSEIINGIRLKGYMDHDYDDFIAKYKKYKKIIHPWVLGRVVKYDSPIPSCLKSMGKIHILNKFYIPFIGLFGEFLGKILNRPLVSPIFTNVKKRTFLITFTRGTGDTHHFFGKIRHKVYSFFKKVLKDDFDLVYIDEQKAVYNNFLKYFLDKKKPEIEISNVNFDEYLKLLSESYFVLNLSGRVASNPFRCVDACLVNSCIISDKIYADSYKDFPCVLLPLDVQQGEFDFEKAEKILKEIVQNKEQKYNELLKKQKKWFQKYLSMENNCKQILQRI